MWKVGWVVEDVLMGCCYWLGKRGEEKEEGEEENQREGNGGVSGLEAKQGGEG